MTDAKPYLTLMCPPDSDFGGCGLQTPTAQDFIDYLEQPGNEAAAWAVVTHLLPKLAGPWESHEIWVGGDKTKPATVWTRNLGNNQLATAAETTEGCWWEEPNSINAPSRYFTDTIDEAKAAIDVRLRIGESGFRLVPSESKNR